MTNAKHTPLPTGLELCQRQREEIRAERNAAQEECERLSAVLDTLAYEPLSIEAINALPEAGGWWPVGMNDKVVALVRAAVQSSARAAIAKARGACHE